MEKIKCPHCEADAKMRQPSNPNYGLVGTCPKCHYHLLAGPNTVAAEPPGVFYGEREK